MREGGSHTEFVNYVLRAHQEGDYNRYGGEEMGLCDEQHEEENKW